MGRVLCTDADLKNYLDQWDVAIHDLATIRRCKPSRRCSAPPAPRSASGWKTAIRQLWRGWQPLSVMFSDGTEGIDHINKLRLQPVDVAPGFAGERTTTSPEGRPATRHTEMARGQPAECARSGG